MHPLGLGRLNGDGVSTSEPGRSVHAPQRWRLNFGPPLFVQTFETAEPTVDERATAIGALVAVRHELPGLRTLEPAWFRPAWPGSATVVGFWWPNRPDEVFIRSGHPLDDLPRLIRHEAAHAACYHRHRNVGDEEWPDRFAAGDPEAVRRFRAFVA